jgi:hypothetical protein
MNGFLFGYNDGVPDFVSKPFKTKAAEKARGRYSAKVRAASE